MVAVVFWDDVGLIDWTDINDPTSIYHYWCRRWPAADLWCLLVRPTYRFQVLPVTQVIA